GRRLMFDRHLLGRGAARLLSAFALDACDEFTELVVQLRNAAHDRLLHVLCDLALAGLRDHLSSALFGLLNARTGLERFQRGLNLLAWFAHPAGKIALG